MYNEGESCVFGYIFIYVVGTMHYILERVMNKITREIIIFFLSIFLHLSLYINNNILSDIIRKFKYTNKNHWCWAYEE